MLDVVISGELLNRLQLELLWNESLLIDLLPLLDLLVALLRLHRALLHASMAILVNINHPEPLALQIHPILLQSLPLDHLGVQ